MTCSTSVTAAAGLGITLILGSVGAQAKTVDGVTFPPSMSQDGKTLVLNGVGTRTISYFLDVYVSALYLTTSASTLDAVLAEPDPKVLVTHYLHDATPDQTKSEYTAIYNRFCATTACSAQSHVSFQKVLDSVTPTHVGDYSTYVIENGTLTVSKDGKPVLTVHDADYARGFLAAVLGSASPSAEYRQGMLGKS
jgi:hypothetical protein